MPLSHPVGASTAYQTSAYESCVNLLEAFTHPAVLTTSLLGEPLGL